MGGGTKWDMMFGSELPLDFSTHCPGVIAQSGVSLCNGFFNLFPNKAKKHKVDLSTIIGVFSIRDDKATNWS